MIQKNLNLTTRLCDDGFHPPLTHLHRLPHCPHFLTSIGTIPTLDTVAIITVIITGDLNELSVCWALP